MQIIDLSQDIYEGMKVYPGHLKTVQFEHATHEETAPRFEGGFSFQTSGFMLNDNGPTHVDSFSHLDPGPVGGDDREDVARPVLRHRGVPGRQ
jgi:Predicted metal-dependent hydrolase